MQLYRHRPFEMLCRKQCYHFLSYTLIVPTIVVFLLLCPRFHLFEINPQYLACLWEQEYKFCHCVFHMFVFVLMLEKILLICHVMMTYGFICMQFTFVNFDKSNKTSQKLTVHQTYKFSCNLLL